MTDEQIAASLCRLVRTFIFEWEGALTMLVLSDFREQYEAAPTPNDQVAVCRRWLAMYRRPLKVVS